MIAGALEIQLLANMARLQTDMDKAKRTVSSTVDAMNKVLGTIGIGVSLAGITSMIKSVVDVGDKLNDLRKITGLTVNELGGLDKQAKLNGTNLDSVAKAIGIMSKNMYTGVDAFKLLGIATRDADGNLRNTNQVLLDVSDRFSRMQDGAQKSAIANQIFGKSGRELIPMLNEGRAALVAAAEAHMLNSGHTNRTAEASDRFNDILVILNGNLQATKNNFVNGLTPALNDIGNAFLKATGSAAAFHAVGQGVGVVLKGVVIAVRVVHDALQAFGFAVDGIIKQFVALINLDYKKAIDIGNQYFANIDKNAQGTAEFIKTIIDGDKAISEANVSHQDMLDIQVQMPSVTDKATESVKRQTKAYDIEIYKLKQYEDLYKKGRDLTERVATSQERYNNELKELEALRPYITVETYNRALEKAQKELKGTEVQTRQTTDEVSQLWMQAGRNIQSTLANSIFNFFDDGLKGMLKNVISTVGRIASEFAALKIAQGIGLAGMFGMSATASASSSGSIVGSLMGLGSNVMSGIKGGFGLSSLLSGGSSGVFSNLGGAGTAFIGGPGTALGGSGLGGLSSLGSSFGAAAGPVMAAFAVDAIGRALAGDKKLGGAEMIPVLGGFLAAMFGHGPMKFRQQSLQGDITSGGFNGDMTNVFRAKGGLFVSNKHKSVTEQLSEEMQLLFDQTITGFYDSTHKFAENLGLDVSLVDNFTKTIQIKSEKNKKLTEEAIADLFKGLNNDIAKNVLPTVDTFKKAGEDSSATLARLSNEFDVLTNAAELLLGKTNKDSKSLISGMGIGDRTSFIDSVGGSAVLSQFTSFYSEQFLTQAERLKPVQEDLVDGLEKLGLSSQLTRDEFRNLVKSVGEVGGISQETFSGLIKLAGAFDVVRDASEAITEQSRQYSFAVFQQRLGIESQLLQLQGNTAELRRRELMQLEPANRALQQRVFDLMDEIDKQAKLKEKTDLTKNAQDDLANTLKDNLATAIGLLDTAFSKLSASVSAQKDILAQANTELEKQKEKATERFNLQEQDAQNRYNALIQQQDDKIAGVVANSAKLAELSQSITGSMLSLQPMSAAVARGQANNAASSGNIGGYDLSNTVSILGQKMGSEGFSNRLDMLRANAANFNALSGLQNAAGGEMSLGDRTIAALEAAKETFADGLNQQLMLIRDSYSVQITQYDAQIKANDAEMIRLDGLMTTAQSQIDVLKGIDSSVLSVADALRNLNFAMSGVTGAQTAIDTSNIARFEFGGKSPKTGLAIIHKDEQITSAKDSAGMTEQISALKSAVEVLTVANNKMNRRFDKWDKEGLPTTRAA